MNINKERIIQIYIILMVVILSISLYLNKIGEALLILGILHFPFLYLYFTVYLFFLPFKLKINRKSKTASNTITLSDVFKNRLIPFFWKRRIYGDPLLIGIYNKRNITTDSNTMDEYSISQTYINKRELCYNLRTKETLEIQTLHNLILRIESNNKYQSKEKRKNIWVSLDMEPIYKRTITGFSKRLVIFSFPIVNYLHFLLYKLSHQNYVHISPVVIVGVNIIIVSSLYFYFNYTNKTLITLESQGFEKTYKINGNDGIEARKIFDPEIIEKCNNYTDSSIPSLYFDLQQGALYCNIDCGKNAPQRPTKDFITKKTNETINLLKRLSIMEKLKNLL